MAHKYKAIPTTVDGIRFDSKKEARRYQELKLMGAAKVIRDLELQPCFEIHACQRLLIDERCRPLKVATYRADFQYWDCERDELVVEDVKGVRTAMYRLKKKLVEDAYGITITEV